MRQSVRKTLLIAVCAVFVCTVMAFAAACGPKAYTLTFVTNGGTEITPITAEAGTAITPPSDPSRDGYSFDGWFETENFSGDAVEIPTTMPDRNITYYAKFTELPKAKLSLDAGEVGTLETSEFEVTVGTNVSEFLADIVPTVSGDVTFGGWFDGDVALSDKQTMPAEGLSLTAKYQVGFTVEVFLQDVEGDGYTQDESASFEQTGWLGDTVTGGSIDFDAPTGYRFNSSRSQSIVLGAGENVFRAYYDRSTYSVFYLANTPAGEEGSGEMQNETGVRNGASVSVKESGFSVEGYRFAGWATSAGGAVAYQPGEKVTIEGRSVSLYACWDYGITDAESGSDKVYILSAEENAAVLERVGLGEKKGTYDPQQRIFTFETEGGKTLRGKVAEDGKTFTYFDEALQDTYQKYDWIAGSLVDGVTLELDGQEGAIYIEDNKRVAGTYAKSGSNYVFTSEDGETSFTFRLGTEDGTETFRVSDGLEGTYSYLSQNTLTALTMMILDGFGSGLYLDLQTSNMGDVVYSVDDLESGVITATLTYINGGGKETASFRAFQVETDAGTKDAFLLVDAARGKHTAQTDEGVISLECDGFSYWRGYGSAIYTDAEGVAHETIYMLGSGYADGDSFLSYILFLPYIPEDSEESPATLVLRYDAAGLQDTELVEKYAFYPETRVKSGVTVRLRLHSDTEATLEVLMTDGTYRLAVRGTYSPRSGGRPFDFEATEYIEYDNGDTVICFEEILKPYYDSFTYDIFTTTQGSVVFMIGDESAGVYEFEAGGSKISLDCDGFGFADLTVDENSPLEDIRYTYYQGYTDDEGEWGFIAFQNGDTVYLIKVDLRGEGATELLPNENALILTMEDMNNRIAGYEEILQLFPDGKAIVHVFVDGKYVEVEGRYAAVPDMENFFDFTAEKYPEGAPADLKDYYGSFRFICITLNQMVLFAAYDEEEVLSFTLDDVTLSLSGYGVAQLGDTQCFYQIDSDNIVTIVSLDGSSSILVKLNEDRTAIEAASGSERGIYYAYVDGGISLERYLIQLDGLGKAALYQYIPADEEAGTQATIEKVTGGDGTYTRSEGDIVLQFTVEGYESFTMTVGTVTSGQTAIAVYIVEDLSLVKSYQIAGGGSIAVDKYNQAVYTDENGTETSVVARVVEDSYVAGRSLLYVYTSGSLTAIYRIDGTELTLLDTLYGKYNELIGGTISTAVYLVLDGRGGAQLVDGDGSILATGQYAANADESAWVFTAEDNSFTFYLSTVTSGSGDRYAVFSRYDETWERSFSSADWEVMILSGHGTVTFIDEKGKVTETFYVVSGENVIGIYDLSTGEYQYYKVNFEDGTFTPTEAPAEEQAA